MKKSFKVLEKAKKKGGEKLKLNDDPMDLARIVMEDADLHHFPHTAFPDLTPHHVYNYLELDGLYVSKKRLKVNNEIREISSEYLDLNDKKNGSYIRNINWLQAKRLITDLHGKMLVPGEFFSILKHMDSTGTGQVMKRDMTSMGREWLDAYMYDNEIIVDKEKLVTKTLFTHAWMDDKSDVVYGGNMSVIDEPETEDWFDYDSINWYQGIPSNKGKSEIFQYLKCSNPAAHALRRITSAKKTGSSCAISRNTATEKIAGVRLCYTKADIEKLRNYNGVGL